MSTQNSRQDSGDKNVKLAQPTNNTTDIYLDQQIPGNKKPMTMLERTGLKGAFGVHASIHKTNALQTFKRKSKAVGRNAAAKIAKATAPGKLKYDHSTGKTNGKQTTHIAPARAMGKGTSTSSDNKASKAATGQQTPRELAWAHVKGLK